MTDLQGAKQQCLMFKNIFISIHLLFRKSGSKGNLLKEFSSFFGNPSFFLFPFGIFHRSFLCLLRQRDKLRNFHSLSKRFSSPSVCHLTGAQFYNLFWKCAPAICLKSNCCGKTAWNLAQTNWTLVESSHSNQSLYIEAFIHKPCKLVAKSRNSRIPIFYLAPLGPNKVDFTWCHPGVWGWHKKCGLTRQAALNGRWDVSLLCPKLESVGWGGVSACGPESTSSKKLAANLPNLGSRGLFAFHKSSRYSLWNSGPIG